MKDKLKKVKHRLAQYTVVRGAYFALLWTYKFPIFVVQYLIFRKKALKGRRFNTRLYDIFPRLFDNTKLTGFDPHYVYHPAWAARIVAGLKPVKHIDVSSFLHFSTLVSAFVPVEFYDYRPAEIRSLSGLECKKGDLTALPFADDSVESISCMHTVEHIGLGRYGDLIDPDGDIKAARELARVIRPGGTLLFVVPVGKSRICFNAHRIYSYEQVMALFPALQLHEFSLVPDDFRKHGLIKDVDPAMVKSQEYACGCFWFMKK